MSSITATFDVQDNVSALVEDMLRQFPKGSRIRVAVSEVQGAQPPPPLAEYRSAIAAARQKVSRGPWKTTAEAMQSLRETEEN